MVKKIVATLLFFLSLYVPAYAAGMPAVIGYQGRLANSSGNLLGDAGTTYYFKFSIWDNPTSDPITGNRLWPSSDPSSVSAVVRQGVFNVNIDVSNYNFNTDEEIYLQVEVSLTSNGTFQTLSPRQRISATPFAQISGAVSGLGQSSFGTTTPVSNAVVSIEATSTSAIPLLIRSFAGQLANLFQIQNSAGLNLFVVDKSGNVGVGTSTATRKFNVLNSDSVAQLRVSQASDIYGEFRADSAGDVRISSTGGNVRQNNENLWVCSGDGCAMDATPPADKGNIIVETAVIFDNKFKFKLKENPGATTTTIMIDSLGNEILEFDEGGGP